MSRRFVQFCSVAPRWAAMVLCLVGTSSCGSTERSVQGTVTVDGQPLETGTIYFRPAEGGTGKGGGGAVNGGQFQLAEKLSPGSYSVQVDGFKKTGRTVNDPQRGKVEETVQLRLQGLPLPVLVSSDNSDNIQIELKTAT